MKEPGHEGVTRTEKDRKPTRELLHSSTEMESARTFFSELGVPLDEDGLIAKQLTDRQVQKLAGWRQATMVGSVEMPDEETFYRKVFAAISLWRQREDGRVTYLLGKGAGVEVALRGNVKGREKREVVFPYRSHSDFELYAVDVTDVYTRAFKTVFGAQEYFPPTKTKALSGLPPELLLQTYETVDLGGVDVLVPELELLYLDKRLASESTPREEGYDHQLLAKQYVLDKEKVLQYLDVFVLPGMRDEVESRYSPEKAALQIAGMKKYMKMHEREHELLDKTEPEDWANALNSFFDTHLHMEMSGISSLYWIPLTSADFTPDRQLADEAGLTVKIQERILRDHKMALRKIEDLRENEWVFFESIE